MERLETSRNKPQVNWISCEDKLPEEYIPVWVAMLSKRCDHDWLVDIGYREGKEWHGCDDIWKYMDISEPLFWAEIEYPDSPEI